MYPDPDQPSIFSRPEDDSSAPRTPPIDRAPEPVQPDRPRDARPAPSADLEPLGRGGRRIGRATLAIGAAGILMLAVAGFVGASLLAGPAEGPALAAGSSSPSATASPVASADPSASASPTPPAASPAPSSQATTVPTPSPTPAGPPQELAVGGWATVTVDELNVRREAGTGSASVYRLVRGAIARVFEGPVARDGLAWYRVGSLGGAKGWAASGFQAEPFLTTFSEDSDLVFCDEVESEVVRVVDGAVRTVDPIRIGELALPAAAFSDMEAAVLELVRATRSKACLGAQMAANEVPVMYTETYIGACGRLTADGDAFRLRPVAGTGFGIESQVKETGILHPALLAASPNMDARVRLAAQGDGSTVCVNAGVTETAGGVDVQASIDGTQCVFVEEHTAEHMLIRSAAGGEPLRFTFAAGQPIEIGTVTLGLPIQLGISTSIYDAESWFWAWENGAC